MAMNADVLGAALKTALDGVSVSDRDALFRAMAQAIITHITTTATVTVTVASVSGVATGPGVSGPGAGTGTIA